MATSQIHHFYHLFADGAWEEPVFEHFTALAESGLADEIEWVWVGFVGEPGNVGRAAKAIEATGVRYRWINFVTEGWEQATLHPLWEFAQDTDGPVLYAHTKGASRDEPIDRPWRRSMTELCVVQWRRCVEALDNGKLIVGCHWIKGQPEIERLSEAWRNRQLNPPGLDGVGGMFGGNFWWTRLELLRQNCEPSIEHRHAAEHWLGQLSEVMPINADTILDLNPRPIVPSNLVPLTTTLSD